MGGKVVTARPGGIVAGGHPPRADWNKAWGARRPVCFVIMPFVERDEEHPAGFFDEVFEQLLGPAVRGAGFQPTTARRAGTDLIQSTIVNALLDADLVLCDLTEHNPNVLFELGLRVANDKPVALVKARGTPTLFDIDHMLRVAEYSPNLWPSTLAADARTIEDHMRAAWDGRLDGRSFMAVLRDPPSEVIDLGQAR